VDNNATGRKDPDSLAPVQLERTSLGEDVALLKRGKGLHLVVTLLIAAVAVVGGTRWMGHIDAVQAYAHAAEQLAAPNTQGGDEFLHCALPNLQPSQLAAAQSLHNAIEVMSERLDKKYGSQLERCAYLLDNLQNGLSAVRAPSDMTRRLDGLRSSAREFSDAWNNYRAYLQDPTQRYDYVRATPMIEKITLAWQAYRTQRNDTQAALRARN
jgi:hypothetical protein